MKRVSKMLVGLFVIFCWSAYALSDTVINYDDGSIYTVPAGEEVYVTEQKLFKKKQWSNGGINFSVVQPNIARDFVPSVTDGLQIGSHTWCKAYVPWSEGLSFDMVAWQRSCDTNDDGKYGCGDNTFDASEDAGVCAA